MMFNASEYYRYEKIEENVVGGASGVHWRKEIQNFGRKA